MVSWIVLAALGQFLLAIVALMDKYIVTSEGAMPRPFVYAFYTCLLSGAWVLVFLVGMIPVPFLAMLHVPSFLNVTIPTLPIAGLSFLSAYTFFAALVSLYTALKEADASDVVPVVGAVSGIASFALSYIFLDTRLTPNFVWGLLVLSVGTFVLSHLRFRLGVALLSIHAGILFAVHYVTIKGLFEMSSFDNGFFWSRVAFIAVAFSVLLVPGHFLRIKGQTQTTTKHTGLLVLGTKLVAGIASIMILKATDWGSVAVVQALGGLQFVFLFALSALLGRVVLHPDCGENHTCNEDLYHKAIGTALITIGFFVLFV